MLPRLTCGRSRFWKRGVHFIMGGGGGFVPINNICSHKNYRCDDVIWRHQLKTSSILRTSYVMVSWQISLLESYLWLTEGNYYRNGITSDQSAALSYFRTETSSVWNFLVQIADVGFGGTIFPPKRGGCIRRLGIFEPQQHLNQYRHPSFYFKFWIPIRWRVIGGSLCLASISAELP